MTCIINKDSGLNNNYIHNIKESKPLKIQSSGSTKDLVGQLLIDNIKNFQLLILLKL